MGRHYLYGRVKLPEGQTTGEAFFLRHGDDGVGYRNPETGDAILTLAVYAEDRTEAMRLVDLARITAREFSALADDLERYIDCHDFMKPGGRAQPECEEKLYGTGARGEGALLPVPRGQ